jgi:hypothetical protein
MSKTSSKLKLEALKGWLEDLKKRSRKKSPPRVVTED